MKYVVYLIAILVTGVSTSIAQSEKSSAAPNASFGQFAELVGDWVGKGMHGDEKHEVQVSYKLTSGGSALVETVDQGGPHEMVTVIHPDGDALLLTHYCVLGNQPHMKATPKSGDKKVAFKFVKATNLKSEKDEHMHDVTFTFIDKDHFKTEWTNYKEGKEGEKVVMELSRKK